MNWEGGRNHKKKKKKKKKKFCNSLKHNKSTKNGLNL